MEPMMSGATTANRLRQLPTVELDGVELPVAIGLRARLLGLALLDPERAGPGLLIPRCTSVHTFGMRFSLDVFFLDEDGAVLEARSGVRPRRVLSHRAAKAVLERPAQGRVHRPGF